MNDQQRQLLESMAYLAQQNNWTDLGTRADSLLTAKQGQSSPNYSIIVPSEVLYSSLLTPFLQWLSEGSIKPISLTNAESQIITGPTSRLVLFLPSNYRIQQADLEQIQRVVLNRPLNSYAIVIGVTDEVTNDWDLKDLEERIRRVFIRTIMGSSYMGQLAEANCFLWTDNNSQAPLLLARFIEDEEKLNTWLTSPSFPAHELFNYHLDRWLNDAQEKMSVPGDNTLSDRSEAIEINDLVVTINEIRTKVNRRLNESQSDVLGELTATLRGTEQAARLRWTKLITDQQFNLSVETATAELHRILDQHLQGWHSKLALNERLNRIIQQATDPLDTINWPRVNDLLAGQPSAVTYPEAFEIKLLQREELQNDIRHPEESLSDQPDRNTKYLRQTALTGVVIAGVYAALGLLPGVIAGGVTALGIHLRNRKDQREIINEEGLQAISRFFQERIRDLHRRLPDVFDPIDQHYNQCFKQLRKSLESKLESASKRQVNGSESLQDVQKKLDIYRHQLQQL